MASALFVMWMRPEPGAIRRSRRRSPANTASGTQKAASVRRVTIPLVACYDPLAGKTVAFGPPPISRASRVFSGDPWTPFLTGVYQERNWLLWVDDAGHFRAWDIAGNKQVRDWALDRCLPLAHGEKCTSVLDGGYITPDGRLMAVAGGKLVVCNCDDGRCRCLCPVTLRAGIWPHRPRVLGCSRDRGVVALADTSYVNLLLLDTASGETLIAGRHEEYDGQDYTSFCGLSFSAGERMLTSRVFGGFSCTHRRSPRRRGSRPRSGTCGGFVTPTGRCRGSEKEEKFDRVRRRISHRAQPVGFENQGTSLRGATVGINPAARHSSFLPPSAFRLTATPPAGLRDGCGGPARRSRGPGRRLPGRRSCGPDWSPPGRTASTTARPPDARFPATPGAGRPRRTRPASRAGRRRRCPARRKLAAPAKGR